tara:strand:+ start:91866 stop:92480 length:615 start_codon:yes stop_codon:yes gene_type:complete
MGDIMIFYFCIMEKKRLALFASGNGSNAIRIIDYFRDNENIKVSVLVCNRENAGVLDKTAGSGIKQVVISNEEASNGQLLVDLMNENEIDYIILCGYLRMIPEELIHSFPEHIVNIHPALLPNYGGPGMYGIHVHRAVKNAGEEKTGITIHLVNEEYDKGKIIAQHDVALSATDSIEDIQKKVQVLEHTFFAPEIENLITKANA